MKKILALISLIFVGCKKKENVTPHYSYDGKWFFIQTISKQYTLDNGDTTFTRNEIIDHAGGQDYIDFRIDASRQGQALLYAEGKTDSMNYEMITPSFFRLDSTLCEITAFADSSFHFKTLIYDSQAVPGKVQVTQDFFTLTR